MDETPRVRRRWLWYGLPVLLGVIALVLVVGVIRFRSWFAVKLEEARQQREAVVAIQRLGGQVGYDYERRFHDYQARHQLNEGLQPPLPGPAWFRERYGLDVLATVESVAFLPPQVGADCTLDDAGLQQIEEPLKSLSHLVSLEIWGNRVTDAGLRHLAPLTQIKQLCIHGTSITDSGLQHIQALTQLEELSVYETGISDAGLPYLAALKNLKRLSCCTWRLEQHVTGDGVAKLKKALPNCRITVGRY